MCDIQTTDLGGNSGCRILLYEKEDSMVFVRKISSDLSYNARLAAQAEKQASFKSNLIKTPQILNMGYTRAGLFYFDMEYIQGITLAKYMETIEVIKIRNLVEMIINNIIHYEEKDEASAPEIFIDKILSLEAKLKCQNNDLLNKAITLLKNHSWNKFKRTSCHGDLTLENIIVKDNQLYLIDFLDSFYDCWIMDIGTLLQDVQMLWSYRMQDEININTIIRLIVFRDILIDEVKHYVGEDYVEIYFALLLKLVRIFPYVKDKKTYIFLNNKIELIMKIIEETIK